MNKECLNEKEMEMVINLFKAHCELNNERIQTEQLNISCIPPNFPPVMQQFYAKFAPVSIKVDKLNVQFYPYQTVFDYASRKSSDLRFIPIAFYNNDMSRTAYIDKCEDGSWNLRVQLPIGDGKVRILGADIFDYLIKLCKRMNYTL